MLNFENAKIIIDKNPWISKLQNEEFCSNLITVIFVVILIWIFSKLVKDETKQSVIRVVFITSLIVPTIISYIDTVPDATAKIEIVDLSSEKKKIVSNNSPDKFLIEGEKIYYNYRFNSRDYRSLDQFAKRVEKPFENDLIEALNKDKEIEIIRQK